mmetsp:Transcript_8066/g.14356  ORF Transcript_8066/g.14356 Transcript_8066/m.14356 type:complete len:374 (+) Transcript_8066:794-1915(+)
MGGFHCVQATHPGVRYLRMRWELTIFGKICAIFRDPAAKKNQTRPVQSPKSSVPVFNRSVCAVRTHCRSLPYNYGHSSSRALSLFALSVLLFLGSFFAFAFFFAFFFFGTSSSSASSCCGCSSSAGSSSLFAFFLAFVFGPPVCSGAGRAAVGCRCPSSSGSSSWSPAKLLSVAKGGMTANGWVAPFRSCVRMYFTMFPSWNEPIMACHHPLPGFRKMTTGALPAAPAHSARACCCATSTHLKCGLGRLFCVFSQTCLSVRRCCLWRRSSVSRKATREMPTWSNTNCCHSSGVCTRTVGFNLRSSFFRFASSASALCLALISSFNSSRRSALMACTSRNLRRGANSKVPLYCTTSAFPASSSFITTRVGSVNP